MLYALLCYSDEQIVANWSEEKDRAVMTHRLGVVRQLAAAEKVGPVVRLMPTTTATTVRKGRESVVIDGPFSETKEHLLGFYVVECLSLEEAIRVATELLHEPGAIEIRPIRHFSDLGRSRTLTKPQAQSTARMLERDVQ